MHTVQWSDFWQYAFSADLDPQTNRVHVDVHLLSWKCIHLLCQYPEVLTENAIYQGIRSREGVA